MFQDKAALRLPDGRTLLHRALDELRHVCQRVVVCGNSLCGDWHAAALPPRVDSVRVLPDIAPELGPLAGLAAALQDAGRHGESYCMLLAVDLVKVDHSMLERLLQDAISQKSAAVACEADSQQLQPLLAVYPTRWSSIVHPQLAAPDRSLYRLLEQQPHVRVPFLVETLCNLNTPEEWQDFRSGPSDMSGSSSA
jgi:molybdopterin-guanine dinucleotide biosynthesis protein A